jgi:Cu(I)/Ag(I) efflux system membrane fusion protein
MKTKTIFLCLTLATGIAFAQHDHSSGHSNAPAHNKKETAHSHRAVPEFQLQLREVFMASLQLKDALVSSDAMTASASIAEIRTSISKVDLSLLKDEALMDWLGYLKILNENLDVISNSNDLPDQRKAFSLFSHTMYKSLKTFGSGGITVYYDHCPMANDKAGAYWLSNSKEIRNPYFGNEMLSCGKVKEIIQ